MSYRIIAIFSDRTVTARMPSVLAATYWERELIRAGASSVTIERA